jgi:hypothetical protein
MVFNVQSFRGVGCDTDLYQLLAEVGERLPVSK